MPPGPSLQASNSRAGPQAHEPTAPGRRELRPYWWVLGIAIVAYFSASFFLSSIRYTGFYAENWDLGIGMQALWSATHGRPFFNAGSYETLGVPTFFQVHPSFLLFPLAAVYAVAPSAYTLFGVQSAAAALAAVPLFCLTRSITGSPRKALWAAVLYLAWTPLLASNLYDFHLELFLPVGLFSMFYFWHERRFVWAGAFAVLAMLTLEIGPLFVAMTAIFFALPPIRASLRRIRSGRTSEPPASGLPVSRRGLSYRLRAWRVRPITPSLALLGLAVVVYLLLRLLQGPWVAFILGPQVVPSGQNWGYTASSFGLSLSNLPVAFETKLTYWFLAFGLLLFIPLLYPRALILAAPWLVFTLFSADPNYAEIGYQYGAVAAYPVFVGLAYGLDRLPLTSIRRIAAEWVRGTGRNPAARPFSLERRPTSASRLVTAGLLGVLAVNLLLSPVNPWTMSPHIPESNTPGYWVTYSPGAGYPEVARVAGLIPPGAYLLASTDLFVFVANDVHAYSMLWYPANPPFLPFNSTNLPPFVFVSQVQVPNIPSWLRPNLGSNGPYGLLAYVPVTAVGTVSLYELGYSGLPLQVGAAEWKNLSVDAQHLRLGPAGRLSAPTSNGSADVVSNVPGGTGLMWFAPYDTLLPGSYVVSLRVRVVLAYPSIPAPVSPVAYVDTWGSIQDPTATGTLLSYNASSSATGFSTFLLTFTTSVVLYDVTIRGFALQPQVQVELSALNVTALG